MILFEKKNVCGGGLQVKMGEASWWRLLLWSLRPPGVVVPNFAIHIHSSDEGLRPNI